MNNTINGFDPLVSTPPDAVNFTGPNIFENAIRDSVSGILRCYTGFFDIFSETIQNALDATQKKSLESTNYIPKIWLEVNIREGILRIVDNGCGMTLEEFLFCFRPNITFKKGQNLRGNKGVGATFIAYGYNFVRLQTKIGENKYSAILRQGRQWVEDGTGKLPRPKFEETTFDVSELFSEESGTCIEIKLTGADFEKPKDFGWTGATTANQWFDMLRLMTPLGGIYLERESYKPSIFLAVIDKPGNKTQLQKNNAEFYYPHEIPGIKAADLMDVRKEINKIEGDLKTRKNKLSPQFKNLQVLMGIWDYKELLAANEYLKLELTDPEKTLIEKYEICIYASQVDSVDTFKAFNNSLGLRANIKLLKGGIQLATDCMPQGDLIPISLSRTSGLADYTFIIVHFKFGDPDTGRKNFQPELKQIAEKLSSKITAYIIGYRNDLLRPDTGSVRRLTPDKEKHEWIKRLENLRDKSPLPFKAIGNNFSYLSEPREEQDVIAIFHQLIGMGIIRGIYFFSSEYNERYDSLIELNYEDKSYLFRETNKLGVRDDMEIGQGYHPMVLEYKFDFDSLVRDFDSEIKFYEHIDLVVCWQTSRPNTDNIYLKSLLIEKEGNIRTIYGSTHLAFMPGRSNNSIFEVIVLEDLLNFLINPETEIANQKVKYSLY